MLIEHGLYGGNAYGGASQPSSDAYIGRAHFFRGPDEDPVSEEAGSKTEITPCPALDQNQLSSYIGLSALQLTENSGSV